MIVLKVQAAKTVKINLSATDLPDCSLSQYFSVYYKWQLSVKLFWN